MFNFLALLGWSLDAETEIMTREIMIANFSLDRVNRSAAVFDRKKLEWMNGVYIRSLGADAVAGRLRPRLIAHGIDPAHISSDRLRSLVSLEIERSRTLAEMEENLAYFFVDALADYDAKAADKHFLKEGAAELIEQIENFVAATQDFSNEGLETGMRAFAEQAGLGFGKLVHPLRLALTGRSASPGIFDVMTALGRERCLSRLRDARRWIESRATPASGDRP
jgi:nondiscriminating glutamyl-tRNA synthetase